MTSGHAQKIGRTADAERDGLVRERSGRDADVAERDREVGQEPERALQLGLDPERSQVRVVSRGDVLGDWSDPPRCSSSYHRTQVRD